MSFLSTLSLRRATYKKRTKTLHAAYFYPRSPCGERHTWARGSRVTYVISIHALLAESDPPYNLMIHQPKNFYPRSPCGERRHQACSGSQQQGISIHALLAESDKARCKRINRDIAFLSTLSLRRATEREPALSQSSAFLSTLSLRRATSKI